MRNDIEVQEAVREMFAGVVPEREKELLELWSQNDLRFGILPDMTESQGNIIMQGGLYRHVDFNHRAMRLFWLASFIAWEGYRAAQEQKGDEGANLFRFIQLITHFRELVDNEDEQVDFSMPSGIPEPGVFPDLQKDPQGRAAAELAVFAVAWAFLHEVRHVKHQREDTGSGYKAPPDDNWKEEFSCDAFATDFMLGQIGKYANSENVNSAQVREKRVTGIYMALFGMTLLAAGDYGKSDTHPALEDRIQAVMKQIGSSVDQGSFILAHDAFNALRVVQPDAPNPFLQK